MPLLASIPLLLLLFIPCAAAQEKWEEIRSIAQSQHEIIMLLIEKKEFSKVPPAAKEIFTLAFPKEHEPKLVEEARLITDALIHNGQTQIAHQVLELAVEAVKSNRSKAEIHKERAYLYKKEGKADEAMKEFEKAVALEKSSP